MTGDLPVDIRKSIDMQVANDSTTTNYFDVKTGCKDAKTAGCYSLITYCD